MGLVLNGPSGWKSIPSLKCSFPEKFFPLSFGNRLFSEQSKKFPEGSEGAFYGTFVPNIGI